MVLEWCGVEISVTYFLILEACSWCCSGVRRGNVGNIFLIYRKPGILLDFSILVWAEDPKDFAPESHN